VIVVSEITESKNDYETTYNTGWDYKTKNDVIILDDDGVVKSEIKGLECEVAGVSEDGEKILCFRGNPDDADDVSRSSDIDLGKMANVSIYTNDGKLLFSKNSPGNGFLDPRLSANGEWIVVKSYGAPFEIYAYGINGEEYLIPDTKVDDISIWSYIGINNEGQIKYEKLKNGNVVASFVFDPSNNIMTRIIEE